MIKNVVFDVGDVLVDFCYKKYMRNLGFSEECVEYLSDNMVVTEFWHELDLGIRTEKDAIEKFTAEIPQYKDEILVFWENIKDIVEEYDYAEPLIQEIKSNGYGVYILSNYPIETAERHWPDFHFLPHTDGHIISGYEKITKPDEGIYRLLESRFGLDLTECIFVDDRKINIEGAERLGMQGILFTGYDNLVKELTKRKILK
ncbi:MAG: HAD family phosphatase [Eubacterium sp.]|nr:HAD family phosphatase [Eubacterium sp.]